MKNQLQYLESKYESILRDQESKDEVSYYTGAMLLLVGLMVIFFLGIFIKANYSIRLLAFVAVLLISLVSYKLKIKKFSANQELSPLTDEENYSEVLKRKLEILGNGLNSRKARVSAVKWFYIINFPIFLFSIKEFMSGPMTMKFLFWTLLLSFLVGLFMWSWFFKSDANKIEEYQSSIDRMISDLS